MKADKPTVDIAMEAAAAIATMEEGNIKAVQEKGSKEAPQTIGKEGIACRRASVSLWRRDYGWGILSKFGEVDTVYARIDQNKAFWVKGEEIVDGDLW